MFFDGEVHIEEDDQCFSCEYFLKGVQCPLLEALAEKVVFLEGDIMVRNCGFYKQFKRHLSILKPGEEEGDEEPPPQAGPGEITRLDDHRKSV